MIITANLWDKKSPINGQNAEILTEHFNKQNGNDDRVTIAFDGVIGRIENVDDSRFTLAEKDFMSQLISGGMSRENAIVKTWEEKIIKEQSVAELEASSLEQLRADVDYILIMGGLL